MDNPLIKPILEQWGLDNPATMQMLLYSLLVISKELLCKEAYNLIESHFEQLNEIIFTLVEKNKTSSNYNSDQKKNQLYSPYEKHTFSFKTHIFVTR
ncbi:hypothetical protein rsdtw13_01080 [Clostridium sp. TW13]|uniref:Uncharacterized protein n=1 Tax=Inconstantimicrobium mannanitabidum TaxID=1604901 RepID=A0ACB5R6X9_9CLOT|nr:hypothetical protein rsdtw13_01080 [Clostridium sp. TW13]